ncbi:MAG: hypothetical protein MJ189_00405 [Coriobacteriales bacterium]|nr:hypothetical protein [Coriobacteriales bacterium]
MSDTENLSAKEILARVKQDREEYRKEQQQIYSQNNFLHLGQEGYPTLLDPHGAIELLSLFDSDNYSFGIQDLGRDGKNAPDELEEGTHHCDFCARPLFGAQYDHLSDGRERCIACSRTVVKRTKEVKELFVYVKEQMKLSYNINFKSSVEVSVVNQRKLTKFLGEQYIEQPGFTPRTLGFVYNKKKGKQIMYLENGAPRTSLMDTMAHEMTHIWQNQFDYFNNLPKTISPEKRLLIVEGMATWSEVQFLKLILEVEAAEDKISYFHSMNDEYGIGFQLYESAYGFSDGGSIMRDTPFNHPDGPLKI